MPRPLCLTAAALPLLITLLAVLPLTSTFASPGPPADSALREPLRDQLTIDAQHDSPPARDHATPSAVNSISIDALAELRTALHVLQTSWFEVWVGNWPAGIDWTRAVINTHLVATLSTVSKALHASRNGKAYAPLGADALDEREVENEISLYFTQNIAYYFGEDAFRIRNEAYDDILWVVLGWLESIKFIRAHSELHYDGNTRGDRSDSAWTWHGSQFIGAFAHRARVFYSIATRGWDTQWCNGGMVWSPYLGPYKNAITNELFISAAVGMYLYFPGDNNTSPFSLDEDASTMGANPYDESYLQSAIDGYAWLNSSGMTNGKGLYVDGFHISGWRKNGTKCDIRNDMVYTYNQGVLLSGLRGLWEATANRTYLEDGHKLVQSVIRATGWSDDGTVATISDHWAGIGRGGILEEFCDASGRCSQDGQTFKSIFFHHLSLFCQPLPTTPVKPGKTYCADKDLTFLHRSSCKQYVPWVAHNAKAALKTRDGRGKFGMWWGARQDDDDVPMPEGAKDYRNNHAELLKLEWAPSGGVSWSEAIRQMAEPRSQSFDTFALDREDEESRSDPNTRGRGRTVETHAGGVAVLRCLWELQHIP